MRSYGYLAFFSVVFGFISHLVEELEVLWMPVIEYLHNQHTPLRDFFFKYVTKGGFELFFVLIPIGCYWGNYGRYIVTNKEKKRKEEVWPFCLNFVIILLHTWFTLSILKLVFTRQRPFQVNDLISVFEEVKVIVEFSYPSGHASGSSACWMFLYMSYYDLSKKHNFFVMGFAITAVALVGISRVYFGVHYPHDIIAGYAMGISIAILFRKYHRGRLRTYICLAEIALGFTLACVLPLEMLDHHPGIVFCPTFIGLVLFICYFWNGDYLPFSSPLRLLSEDTAHERDLPFKMRMIRLVLGVVMMFTIPFPVLYLYVIGSHYLVGIPYAIMVVLFLLVIIPYTFTLLSIDRVKQPKKITRK